MNLVPMRYMGYTWHHNPKFLQIESEKRVVRLSFPFADDLVQLQNEKPQRISGVGELYGSDCIEQYKRLYQLYKKGEKGILCLPTLAPLYACFESLSLEADDKKGVVTYKFSFSVVRCVADSLKVSKSVLAMENDTLWDIACRTNTDIDTLIQLNTHIMFINDIKAGTRVRVC